MVGEYGPWFSRVYSTNVFKTLWKKEKEIAFSEHFLLSHSVFCLSEEASAIFIKFEIVVCKLFQFKKSLEIVVWKRVKKGKLEV